MRCTNSPVPEFVDRSHVEKIFKLRHNSAGLLGWAPNLRQLFGYFIPDEYYEALVATLVKNGSHWLDVGCGRNIFPNNVKLAQELAERCNLLVGVDPDETIQENGLLHHRVVGTIENFDSEAKFDVITLRMVAEHIACPELAVKALSRLTQPGGLVVIYTINRRSPVSIISFYTPFSLHGPLKRFFWNTEDKDTFPVYYRMNTRKELGQLLAAGGFQEILFTYLDDCRSLSRFRVAMALELSMWRILKQLGLSYPENCLLGVYRRL